VQDRGDEWDRWYPVATPADRNWAILREVHVKGTRFRRPACLALIKAFKEADRIGVPYTVEVEREPDNPADRHAIAVYGVLSSERHQLGYVPRDVAAEIAAEYPLDMPLTARLRQIATIDVDGDNSLSWEDSFAIFVDVLRPAKRSAWWKSRMGDQ
jgi:hypothetical protein